MKNLVKNFGIFFIVFIIIAVTFSMMSGNKTEVETVGVQTLVYQIKNDEVNIIKIKENVLEIELHDGRKEEVRKELGEPFAEMMANYGVDSDKLQEIDIRVEEKSGANFWLTSILPFALPFLLIVVFIWFMMRGVQGANSKAMMFGQSQAKQFNKEGKDKTTFADVAGAKEAKEELQEVVQFLKTPKKFHDLGAKIPRGVLLLGSPGTGKTLMARSVAGEAGVPFLHISGSEFVEMFVGVGASRVRSLFSKAKKQSPCIIFIDEIDAVGRKRGSGMGGSHDEREQTLNQILVEMDGFEATENVIVLAATNRPDVLDPALLRPGRFDRQVVIDLPDINDREAILQVHAKKKPITKDLKLRTVAERTPGFSGADLANVLNEAAILTARKNKKEITQDYIFESIEKVMMGPERRGRVITENEKKITAYHEAGHAIVANFLPNADPVHKVSIIARGQAGGYTLKLPTEDKHMHSRSYFIDEIAVLLGGHVTEKAIFGEVTTGATSDLRRATRLARRMITDFGMAENLGPRTFGEKEEMIFLGREIHEQRDYSEKVAEMIDEEISSLIAQGKKKAEEIVAKHRDAMEKVVVALMERETIEKKEFEELVA